MVFCCWRWKAWAWEENQNELGLVVVVVDDDDHGWIMILLWKNSNKLFPSVLLFACIQWSLEFQFSQFEDKSKIGILSNF